MPTLGLETQIVDQSVYDNSVQRFREDGIVLPRFSQLADPRTIPTEILAKLEGVDPDEVVDAAWMPIIDRVRRQRSGRFRPGSRRAGQ